MPNEFLLCVEDELSEYSFPDDHPFGVARLFAFKDKLEQTVSAASYGTMECRQATDQQLELFHDKSHVEWIKKKSREGCGFLDHSDTPAFSGVFEAASRVAGTVLAGIDRIMKGEVKRVFVPIAGLHHARRNASAGFCVFNDIGVAIEYLRTTYGVRRIAYIDIDAHHGDGVFYEYESDPDLLFVDFHEDGHFIYPGTGHAYETGRGVAAGTKMNLPLPMNAEDDEFLGLWPGAEAFIDQFQPEIILLQAGADSLQGDPVTDMALTTRPHAFTTERLRYLADKHCEGRMLVLGGGGYNLRNVADAWVEVVKQLI